MTDCFGLIVLFVFAVVLCGDVSKSLSWRIILDKEAITKSCRAYWVVQKYIYFFSFELTSTKDVTYRIWSLDILKTRLDRDLMINKSDRPTDQPTSDGHDGS